ncbi:MAG: RNA methyltransferase [Chloroherpetonaceae bacterium]|nr:RNA methyltransferase [Chloroherpetonaceae bacterium]MDW8436569.1 RNA methyltransferase [Chloroherpetonaceae bacterium]
MNRLSPDAFKAAKKFPIRVMLQNLRSMWNVGSIFRSCDAARVEKIIITGYTATPPRKEIDKTALGATEWVEWEYVSNPLDAISRLKAQGVKIAALEIATNAVRYDSLSQKDFPLCLVVGNEVTGIDDDVLAACDLALEIPQYGVKHSLNAAVAVGIALFELVKACGRVD